MKKLLALLSILTIFLFISSCGEEPIEEKIEETFIDDANAEETAADTSSTGVYQEEVSDEETSLQDAINNNNAEEVVEEGGMSFCDCVKENKRLDDIMMADETSDADFDKAMADKEALKKGDCKILFSGSQNTIDEKKAHERKVKRCL
jgi:hypothetical protein